MTLPRHNPPCDDPDCMPCWWDALDREMFRLPPVPEGRPAEKPKLGEYVAHYAQRAFWRIVRTEWDENWKAWPHCNGQARCWTHTSSRWCACSCRWCRIARWVRPTFHRERAEP